MPDLWERSRLLKALCGSPDQHSCTGRIDLRARLHEQAIPGRRNIRARSHLALEGKYPAQAIPHRVVVGYHQLEVRPVDQRSCAFCRYVLDKFFRKGPRARDVNAVIKMKLTGPAVVIKAIGDIGVLLELEERDAGTDGVDRG